MNPTSQSLVADASPPADAAAGATSATPLSSRARIRVWDLPTRAFHWSLVAAVLTAVITGQIGGDWMRVHGLAGLCIVGLVVFRIVWGLIGSTHARFASFVPTPKKVLAYLRGHWQGVGHNPLGALSVLLLLSLLAVQAATGLFSNDDISFTGPLAVLVSDALSLRLTGWHHQIADVLLVFIGLHVLAIVFYVWFMKDNLVKPMVTGYKEVAAGEPARKGGWLAFAVALLAAVTAVVVANGALFAHETAPIQQQPSQRQEPSSQQQPQQKAATPAW